MTEIETGISFIYRFVVQMDTMARSKSDQKTRTRILISRMRERAQILGLSAIAFPGISAVSWNGSRAAGLKPTL